MIPRRGILPRSKGTVRCYGFSWIDRLWSSAGEWNGHYMAMISATAIAGKASVRCANTDRAKVIREARAAFARWSGCGVAWIAAVSGIWLVVKSSRA